MGYVCTICMCDMWGIWKECSRPFGHNFIPSARQSSTPLRWCHKGGLWVLVVQVLRGRCRSADATLPQVALRKEWKSRYIEAWRKSNWVMKAFFWYPPIKMLLKQNYKFIDSCFSHNLQFRKKILLLKINYLSRKHLDPNKAKNLEQDKLSALNSASTP